MDISRISPRLPGARARVLAATVLPATVFLCSDWIVLLKRLLR